MPPMRHCGDKTHLWIVSVASTRTSSPLASLRIGFGGGLYCSASKAFTFGRIPPVPIPMQNIAIASVAKAAVGSSCDDMTTMINPQT